MGVMVTIIWLSFGEEGDWRAAKAGEVSDRSE